MDFLQELEPWHWVILCFLLLGVEALGAGGFLLGAAAAAVVQALLLWMIGDFSWPWQLASYGSMTLVFSIIWWVFLRKPGQNTADPLLNNRAAQMIGRVITLEEDIPAGQGRVQIGDTKWKVSAFGPLHKGDHVLVASAEGMTLTLQRMDNPTA
ncbi:NfeD family protein [Parendozoicomonas haliclonae]|uniref:Inner membrane protein YbbJ n=1 Tax=Parendozoicomonas haliclonae TaxID=1960125 RepID=A0A1X7AKD1_9GAMM|nr:NfeD family protein [Parendozoicomonas haliclonae]SMA47118.1 Inner membrane protein YbbJ [Parendozoicomonas haliclonae]